MNDRSRDVEIRVMSLRSRLIAAGVIPFFLIVVYLVVPDGISGTPANSPLVVFVKNLFFDSQMPQQKVLESPALVTKEMTIPQKKSRFIKLLSPEVDRVYLELEQQYRDVIVALKNGSSREKIDTLKREYRARSDADLLAALRPHPRSIALAQAALESSWATSRFFREANNVFGVWSFNENEPRIAASEKRGEKTIWLKKYDSIYDSVKDNYRVLARGEVFQEFRDLRVKTQNPFDLIEKLHEYSEKGESYVRELASVISYNKFARYDDIFFEFQSVKIPSREEGISLKSTFLDDTALFPVDMNAADLNSSPADLNILNPPVTAETMGSKTRAELELPKELMVDENNTDGYL